MTGRYFVRPGEVAPYSPANHTGTVNRRLISPDTVGSQGVELVHGTLQPGEGAARHSHPGIEQVCYVLEGRAMAEIDGQSRELGKGDCCYFPADRPHVFTAIGDHPVEILVIYTPPYGENPEKVKR